MSMRQLKISKSITSRECQSLEKYLQEIGKVDLITAEEEVILATAPVNPVVVPLCATFKRIAPVCDEEAFVMLTTLPTVVWTPITARVLAWPVVEEPVIAATFPV